MANVYTTSLKGLLISLLLPMTLYGQLTMPKVSPTGLAYGKYADIPVDASTGTADITVPLHTVTDGPLSLPIFLQYHTAGQLVSSPASNVGMGWNLNTGGMVSRTIMGKADEETNGYIKYRTTNRYPTGDADPVYDRDTEPDIFTYSVPGYAGKFFLPVGGKVQTIPRSDVKITIEGDKTSGGILLNIEGITIVTPDGVIYRYGQVAGTNRYAYDYVKYNESGYTSYDRSGWHLMQIQTPDLQHQIDIEYTRTSYTYLTQTVCAEEVKYRQNNGTINTANVGCLSTKVQKYYNYTVTPKRIISTNETIDFSQSAREDLAAADVGDNYKVDAVSVSNGSICFKWKFIQSYFKSSSSAGLTGKRLKLDAVQRQACSSSTVSENPWSFTYAGSTNSDGTKFFPSTSDKNIDHWGYYNKAGSVDNNANGDITPRTGVSLNGEVTYYGSAERKTNEEAMRQGALQQITYPTGGYLSLTYGANRYVKSTVQDTAFSATGCAEGCAGLPARYVEQTYTPTQSLLESGRWLLIVTPEPGMSNSPYYGKVEIFPYGGTTPISTVEFDQDYILEYTLPKVSFTPSDQPMVAGQKYKIRVTYYNAKVRFVMVDDTQPVDGVCGGLRIQQTKIHDGITTTNDQITTFSYTNKTNPSISSGVLYRTPVYGYRLNYATAIFNAYSMAPLSAFSGYHIGYERVVITKSGLGQEERIYFKETESTSTTSYPIRPAGFLVYSGVLKESKTYAHSSTTAIATSTTQRYNSDSYTTYGNSTANGYIFATRKLPIYESGSVKVKPMYTGYTIRTSIFRPSKVTSVVDGISTETNYTYGSVVLAPQGVETVNSDNTKIKTVTTYSAEHPTSALRTKFIEHNILYLPYKSETFLNGSTTPIAGSNTTFKFFKSDGSSPSDASTDRITVPRVYEQSQLEKTYDASGSLTGSTSYQTVQTILTYTSAGFPKTVSQPGWTNTTYTYGANNLLTQQSFGGRTTSATYAATGGTYLQQTTASDGTTTSYTYDALGRLKTVTDDCQNIVTTYTYHFTTGSTDKNYTEVKVDFPKPSSNSALDIVETRTYLDGLGRPIQTVAKKQGPSATQDIIAAQEYDKYGRVYRTYEPYAADNNGGAYKAPSTSWGYTQTTFETSPLSRTLTVTPPSWSATTYSYGTNTADDAVKKISATGNYDASALAKLVVKDGNGNKLITFTDKFGRKVLSRRTTDADAASARLDTYYIYDGKGRLTKVLPPGSSTTTTKLIYTYLYDGKDQLIEKTVPGKEKEEFKYNSQQLLAASRDGKLRAASKWYVYNYDGFGRTLQSGLYGSTLPSDLSTVVPADILMETGYGTQDYNWDKVTLIKTKVLGSTSSFITTTSTYTSCGVLSEQRGNNHLLLSPTDGEKTTYTYDGAGNVVGSTYTHKAPSQTHTITSASFLDHAGRTISDDFKVDAGTNRKVHQFVYDQKGNVVTKYQGATGKSGALAYLQKIDYSYLANGLLQGININTSTGKLSGSQVGLPANGAAATAPSPATPSSTSYDDRDLFYLELYRNQAATGISTTSFPTRANGDIVTVATQVRGRRQQLWATTYDSYDRMRNTAFYQREHRTSTPTAYANYNEDITGYDPRGNITGLNRDDSYLVSGTYRTAWIDELEYTYEASSNRLSSVTEDSGNDRGYPDVTGSFTYDQNGNVTYDPARRVTLVYNHLNLPERISWADGRKLEMTYDAGGTLLSRKTVAANGTVVEERHYVGGIEYVKSGTSYVLESVHHSEGRILFAGTTQEWQYTLTDHLGNTRLVYADRNGDGIVAVQSEIVQEEHYFPFGMKMTGPWMGGTAGAKTKYQYNGIEYVDAFALNVNMAAYRTLDPTIGRWWGVDPKAEHDFASTPYNAMYNSPLVYNDPNGDCPQCIIGGIVGGLLNLGSQALQGNVTGIKSGLSYFAIGAGAGVLASTGNLGAARALTVGGNKVVQIATGKFSSENLKSPMGLLQTGLSVAGDFGIPGLSNTIARPLASGLASLGSNLFNTTVSGGGQIVKQVAAEAADDIAFSVGFADDIVVSAARVGSNSGLSAASAGSSLLGTQGQNLRAAAQNPKLQNIVADLYRRNAQVGSGSAMDAFRFERATGQLVGGRSHHTKLLDYRNGLQKLWRNRGNLSVGDRQIVKQLLGDIQNALSGL